MESLLPRGLKAPTGRLPVRWPPGLGTAASGCACLKGAAGEATVLESSPRVVGSHWRDGRGQSQSRNTSGPGAARGRISSLGTRAVGGTARVRVPGSRERDEQSFDPALRPSLSQPEPDPQLLPELPRLSPLYQDHEEAGQGLEPLRLLPQGLLLPVPAQLGAALDRPDPGGDVPREDLRGPPKNPRSRQT